MSSFFILFLVFSTSSAARFHSWAEVSFLAETKDALNRSHSICKQDGKIHDAYVASLFCESNGMKLNCKGDFEIIEKLVSDEVLSDKEIIDICVPQSFEDQGNKMEMSCIENTSRAGVALLVCPQESYENAIVELTKFASETKKNLPNFLQAVKDQEFLTAVQKERIMRAYLRYHPRYLWAAFIARETQ